MLKALAPGLKAMLLTSVVVDVEMSVVLETSKVAVSLGPFGTVFGIQFVAVFQSPLIGFMLHVALSAKAACDRMKQAIWAKTTPGSQRNREIFMPVFYSEPAAEVKRKHWRDGHRPAPDATAGVPPAMIAVAVGGGRL